MADKERRSDEKKQKKKQNTEQETIQAYRELVQKRTPRPNILRNFVVAFTVGGLFCVLGQFVLDFFIGQGFSMRDAISPTLAVMIFLGALLTGLGVYDEIGQFAGAGAAVPITGFANTMAAAAMDFKREGFLLGMGSKIFSVAGPVIVYGVVFGILISLLNVYVF